MSLGRQMLHIKQMNFQTFVSFGWKGLSRGNAVAQVALADVFPHKDWDSTLAEGAPGEGFGALLRLIQSCWRPGGVWECKLALSRWITKDTLVEITIENLKYFEQKPVIHLILGLGRAWPTKPHRGMAMLDLILQSVTAFLLCAQGQPQSVRQCLLVCSKRILNSFGFLAWFLAYIHLLWSFLGVVVLCFGLRFCYLFFLFFLS